MKISLIATVKDDAPFVRAFVDSIHGQTRPPDEVVIVDGGSSDGTLDFLRAADGVRLVEERGANIARGRNVAIRAASNDVIAVSDADCVLAPDWLEQLLPVLEAGADVAAGAYVPLATSFLETCMAAVSVRNPDEIRTGWMPSHRSVAFRRSAFERAGGYPEWLDIGEDMYLNHQLRRSGARIEFAPGAKTYWRPRPTLAATWQQYYCATKSVENGGDPSQLTAPDLKGNYGSVIPSLNKIADPQSPPFDLSIPDIYRYEIWKQDFEQNGLANFGMIWLSSDHTGGPTTPEAGVADNDLATGDIVDTISHSRYWKDTAIFVFEDDSQDGADHVDGHRAPVQIVSPWAQHGKVINTYYSQISAVRTIEQILGAQPLNEKVAAATPMYDAFTTRPNYRPFNAVPNQVPLTEGITTPPACGLDTLGQTGAAAAAVKKSEVRATVVPAKSKM